MDRPANWRAFTWTAVKRGWAKRCPHCGRGPIFQRWTHTYPRCRVCGLVFERDYGDSWGFLIVTDRIPLLVAIAAVVFFGVRVTNPVAAVLFFLALAGPIVATMPRRQGVGIALAYVSRVYARDADDRLPGVPEDAEHR
jgi:uncharacterized protein (DUF983 family)